MSSRCNASTAERQSLNVLKSGLFSSHRGFCMPVAEIVEVNLRDLAKKWGCVTVAVLGDLFMKAGHLGIFWLGIFCSEVFCFKRGLFLRPARTCRRPAACLVFDMQSLDCFSPSAQAFGVMFSPRRFCHVLVPVVSGNAQIASLDSFVHNADPFVDHSRACHRSTLTNALWDLLDYLAFACWIPHRSHAAG